MKKIYALLTLLAIVGCNFTVDGRTSEAQALAKFHITGDLCSGAGTKAFPMLCAIVNDSTVNGTGSAGSPLSVGNVIGGMNFGIFGDGYEGTCHITSNFSLTTDSFCNDLTIDAGVWLYTAGFRVFVKGTLYLNGAIGAWGVVGANGVNGAVTVAACATATGGTSANAVVLSGRAGGNGAATPTAGTVGGSSLGVTDATSYAGAAATGTGTNGTTATTQFRGGGGASAGGFVGTPSTIGGNSGTTTTLIAVQTIGADGDMLSVMRARAMGTTSTTQWTPGTGGGGGSCGKATVQPTHRVPGGGGGGQGGGFTIVFAREIVYGVSGQFWSYGGDGGTGASCGTHDGDATGGGGGGGGGGGAVFVVVGTGNEPTGAQMITTGGHGGAGGTGCVGGVNGGTGGDGAAGVEMTWKAGL